MLKYQNKKQIASKQVYKNTFRSIPNLIRFLETIPSTAKQKTSEKFLLIELLAMGISDAHLDEYGYVYWHHPFKQ